MYNGTPGFKASGGNIVKLFLTVGSLTVHKYLWAFVRPYIGARRPSCKVTFLGQVGLVVGY